MWYSRNLDLTYFGPKSYVWQGKPKLMLYTNFSVASCNGCRNKWGLNFRDAPLDRNPPMLVIKVVSC